MRASGGRRMQSVTVQCSSCGAADAIQIDLTLPDKTEVTFNSCHSCEHRWWDADGRTIQLTTVLKKARRPR